jgi:activating signal cointegrator complex subunit 1
MAATVESEDGVRVQEVGCSTSSTISNEHLMQGNVENKVLEGDSSLSAEKHSISVKARLYIFTSLFIVMK